MRPRFSLRTLLALTTVLAFFCYYWIILPTHTARCFVSAIKSENFSTADHLFWQASDRTLADLKDKRWGFNATAGLAPWSFSQLITGRREVAFYMTYFQFDETHETRMQLSATPFGVQSPRNTVNNSAAVIDRTNAISIKR